MNQRLYELEKLRRFSQAVATLLLMNQSLSPKCCNNPLIIHRKRTENFVYHMFWCASMFIELDHFVRLMTNTSSSLGSPKIIFKKSFEKIILFKD